VAVELSVGREQEREGGREFEEGTKLQEKKRQAVLRGIRVARGMYQ